MIKTTTQPFFFSNLIASSIIYLIVFFSAPLVADFYELEAIVPIMRLYCVIFIIQALGSVHKTILTIELQFKKQMLISIPALVLSSAISVYLAYSSYGVWSLVWAAITYSALSTIQLWIVSKWRPILVFNNEKFERHFSFGYKLSIAGVINIVFNNIYYVIIGKFYSLNEVGYYQRADSLKQLPVANLSMILDKITYPLLAKIQDDAPRVKLAYRKVMQLVIFTIAPIMVMLIVVSDALFVTLFSEKWLAAAPLFKIIALGSILYPLQVYHVNILKLKGRTDLVLRLVIIIRLISLVVISLTFNYNIEILLWSQVVIALVTYLIYGYASGRLINYSVYEQVKDILPSILLSILLWVELSCIYDSLLDYRILFTVLAGGLSYLLMALVLRIQPIITLKDLLRRS